MVNVRTQPVSNSVCAINHIILGMSNAFLQGGFYENAHLFLHLVDLLNICVSCHSPLSLKAMHVDLF